MDKRGTTDSVDLRPMVRMKTLEGELTSLDAFVTNYVKSYESTLYMTGWVGQGEVYLVDNEGKPLKMSDEKGKALKYSVVSRDGYRAKLPVE